MRKLIPLVTLSVLTMMFAASTNAVGKTRIVGDPGLPMTVYRFPVVMPHYRITLSYDTTVLTIIPMIDCGNENPQIFMRRNWHKYNTYSHEALQWLEDREMGRTARRKLKIKLEWWGHEFWPPGVKSPEATFHPGKIGSTIGKHEIWDPKTMFPCDYPLPIAVEQLPVKKPHFRIYITFDTGTLTIAPGIFYGNENPQTWAKKNWKKYNVYAHEALQWLEDHKLGRSVRKEWDIKIDWWMREYWPRGVKSPEQTFRAKAAKPKPKAHPAKATAKPPKTDSTARRRR